MSRLCLMILGAVLLVFPPPPQLEAQQGLAAAPAPHVELENDYVRVSVVGILPGTRSSYSVPSGRSAVIVRLGAVLEGALAGPDGAHQFKLDSVVFLRANEVSIDEEPKNGNGAREIRIVLKAPPPASVFEKDAVSLDPPHNKVHFENDRVRVVEVHFGLGEKGPIVDKRPRVIILVTDMHAKVVKPGGSPEARDGTAGTIYWSLGGSQATINQDKTPLDNIVIELKGK